MKKIKNDYLPYFKEYIKDLTPIPHQPDLVVGTCQIHNKKKCPLFVLNRKTGSWMCFESNNCGCIHVFKDMCTKDGDPNNILLQTYQTRSKKPEKTLVLNKHKFDIIKH